MLLWETFPKLANVDALFGLPTSSSTAADPATLLANLATNAQAGSSTQFDGYQAALQAEVASGLFGGATGNSLPGSLLNLTA